MEIEFKNKTMVITPSDKQLNQLQRIHENWPLVLDEMITMIITNRADQLEYIEIVDEIRKRRKEKAEALAKEKNLRKQR